MPKLTDPDSLNDGVEIDINVSSLNISLNLTGNLSNDGVTGLCIYSKLKELWRTNSTYVKYPFPMESITPEQFEFINGWRPANDATRRLIRDAGWAEKSATGAVQREYAGIISLGTMGTADQPYYQQGASLSAANFFYQGVVNEAIQIYGDATNGNFTRKNFLKLFAREYNKKYAQSQISAIGVSNLTYIVYRFPLGNEADLKITAPDSVMTNSPYSGITVTYIAGNGFQPWSSSIAYEVDNVVSRNGRWYLCKLAHTNHQPPNTTYWDPYPGERQIGSTWYAFNKIINGNNAVAENIYTKIQFLLRQNTDIDSGPGTVNGRTADDLLEFVGDTLKTKTGTYIDNFHSNDTNRIIFTDVLGTEAIFPFVAAGELEFNIYLTSDINAKYWLFFETLPGSANFGTSSAVIVNDANGVPITGDVNGRSSISWTFAYDSNSQGGRTPGTDAQVRLVAIGLATGQYVSSVSTITRAVGQKISVAAALERNYSNP